jgi:hypothetical protein
MRTLLTVLSLVLCHTLAMSQTQNWEQTLNQSMNEFKSCMSAEDKTVCQTYTAKAIKQVHKINDFYNATSKTDMSPFEIQEFIKESANWTLVGPAYKSETLVKAQELCNSGKVVLVVLKGDSPADTHVSLVLPGDLQNSGSWAMRVPNVSAFFTHNPDNSFVNKSISYAYTKSMMLQLEVYSRK